MSSGANIRPLSSHCQCIRPWSQPSEPLRPSSARLLTKELSDVTHLGDRGDAHPEEPETCKKCVLDVRAWRSPTIAPNRERDAVAVTIGDMTSRHVAGDLLV